MKRHFYLMCVLPVLESFGSIPPINKQDLLDIVTESDGPANVLKALLLSDDLLVREAVFAGEIEPDQADLTVLSLEQANNEQSLPPYLEPEPEDETEASGTPIAVDRIWRHYFHYAAKIARRTRTRFLAAWVGFEVGLRNALAGARAQALELDPEPYMVAPELAHPDISFDHIPAQWAAASNPIEALEVLDRVRWNWLTEHEQWYSFGDDEVAAYTAKLMLLHRWRRMSESG